jgi:hypothetical protein
LRVNVGALHVTQEKNGLESDGAALDATQFFSICIDKTDHRHTQPLSMGTTHSITEQRWAGERVEPQLAPVNHIESRPGLSQIAHLPTKNPLVGLNLSQRLGAMNPPRRAAAQGAGLDPRGLPMSVRNRALQSEVVFLKNPRETQARQDNENLSRELGTNARLFNTQY